jgi:hypothetical protein
VIALSGIDDVDRQNQINRLVTHNKGIFVRNIERPVRVTHLLCSGDEKTEKMNSAEKFNQKGEADIKLVWEEWFWDCINFKGTASPAICIRKPYLTLVSRAFPRRQVLDRESTA